MGERAQSGFETTIGEMAFFHIARVALTMDMLKASRGEKRRPMILMLLCLKRYFAIGLSSNTKFT